MQASQVAIEQITWSTLQQKQSSLGLFDKHLVTKLSITDCFLFQIDCCSCVVFTVFCSCISVPYMGQTVRFPNLMVTINGSICECYQWVNNEPSSICGHSTVTHIRNHNFPNHSNPVNQLCLNDQFQMTFTGHDRNCLRSCLPILVIFQCHTGKKSKIIHWQSGKGASQKTI